MLYFPVPFHAVPTSMWWQFLRDLEPRIAALQGGGASARAADGGLSLQARLDAARAQTRRRQQVAVVEQQQSEALPAASTTIAASRERKPLTAREVPPILSLMLQANKKKPGRRRCSRAVFRAGLLELRLGTRLIPRRRDALSTEAKLQHDRDMQVLQLFLLVAPNTCPARSAW